MTTTAEVQNAATEQHTVESLALAIKRLSFKDKERLLDMIEQQIFEEEEDNYEETEESLAELAAARAEIEAGNYVTVEDYIGNRSLQTL